MFQWGFTKGAWWSLGLSLLFLIGGCWVTARGMQVGKVRVRVRLHTWPQSSSWLELSQHPHKEVSHTSSTAEINENRRRGHWVGLRLRGIRWDQTWQQAIGPTSTVYVCFFKTTPDTVMVQWNAGNASLAIGISPLAQSVPWQKEPVQQIMNPDWTSLIPSPPLPWCWKDASVVIVGSFPRCCNSSRHCLSSALNQTHLKNRVLSKGTAP